MRKIRIHTHKPLNPKNPHNLCKAVYVRTRHLTRKICTQTYAKAIYVQKICTQMCAKAVKHTQSYIHLRKQSADVLSKARSRLKHHGTQQKIKVPTKWSWFDKRKKGKCTHKSGRLYGKGNISVTGRLQCAQTFSSHGSNQWGFDSR